MEFKRALNSVGEWVTGDRVLKLYELTHRTGYKLMWLGSKIEGGDICEGVNS